MLNEVPMRGTGTPMPPTDPLIYRFYELLMVNGPALKAPDRGGIRRRHHVGDRLRHGHLPSRPTPRATGAKLGMTGKFLPYKYYWRDGVNADLASGAERSGSEDSIGLMVRSVAQRRVSTHGAAPSFESPRAPFAVTVV